MLAKKRKAKLRIGRDESPRIEIGQEEYEE